MYRYIGMIIFMVFFSLQCNWATENSEISARNNSTNLFLTSIDQVRLDSIKPGSLQKEQIADSLVAYLNQQDWSYLKAKNDWGGHGELITYFNTKGIIKKVRSDFHSGYTHQDDIYLGTADRLKRQVRKTLKKRDFAHLNPPLEYRIKLSLTYTTVNRELVWSSGESND